MPRYAILEHDHPTRHWDFLLESSAVLLAWRLSAPPTTGAVVEAEKSFDHRPLYLDYEGQVGGGRGRVTRWDGGSFEWQTREPGRVTVLLAGARLRGLFRLECVHGGAWRADFTAGESSAGT